jgi:hypothetical protein
MTLYRLTRYYMLCGMAFVPAVRRAFEVLRREYRS